MKNCCQPPEVPHGQCLCSTCERNFTSSDPAEVRAQMLADTGERLRQQKSQLSNLAVPTVAPDCLAVCHNDAGRDRPGLRQHWRSSTCLPNLSVEWMISLTIAGRGPGSFTRSWHQANSPIPLRMTSSRSGDAGGNDTVPSASRSSSNCSPPNTTSITDSRLTSSGGSTTRI